MIGEHHTRHNTSPAPNNVVLALDKKWGGQAIVKKENARHYILYGIYKIWFWVSIISLLVVLGAFMKGGYSCM